MSKSGLSPIELTVKKHVEQYFSGPADRSFVTGVSGGADSMCLLHILHTLGIKTHVVHINYQKRGIESDRDAKMVARVADELGMDCEITEADPAGAEEMNFQQWARNLRYGAMEKKRQAAGARAIVTAHHQDDQIETILQKLFRGSGLASWSGMQVWDAPLFRPLLHVSREDIENYCSRNDIPYRTDRTNLESDYARNFIRNEWLPEIKQHFPGWRKNVLRMAEQSSVFESSLAYILRSICDEKDRIRRDLFLQLDEKLQKAVLLYYIKTIDASLTISRPALKELSKLEQLPTGKSLQLTEEVEFMRDRDQFKLVLTTGEEDAFLLLQKEEIASGGISFNGLLLEIQSYQNPDFDNALYLDLDALAWPLRLRQWKSGDRFQPLGMDGHQSVAGHLTNRKVSAAEKNRAFVLESFEETICAVIFPPIENRRPPGTISELMKCEPSTRKCLTIKRIL